eukprot:TRINITY_DN109117_c0_g1_i1.p1 TRINITY_DN109117_c0_g1~~TRINITY_DN109117_c0_g1_i1.p1  ORF type:complete len:304 (+),score=53.43 TRINITY_DN109117_c0_g1_i1:32-913(+)
MAFRGPADTGWHRGTGNNFNPVVPRAKEDKDFAAANEERRRRQEADHRDRMRMRILEGGRGGGLNDRQDPTDRVEWKDDGFEFDEFGRRCKRKSLNGSSTAGNSKSASGQDKKDRMAAALERLRQRGRDRSPNRLEDGKDRSRSRSRERDCHDRSEAVVVNQRGDWQCPNSNCQNHTMFVFGKNESCPKCGSVRPAQADMVATLPELSNPRGDWKCPNKNCQNHAKMVFGKHELCPKCGSPKPMQAGMGAGNPNDWMCPTPDCKNNQRGVFAKHMSCPKCGAAKPVGATAMRT